MQVPLELIEKVSQVVFLKIQRVKLAFHHEFVELCLQWCSFLAIVLSWSLDTLRFYLQMTVELGQAGCISSSKVLVELSLCQISQLNFLLLQ